MEGPEKGLVWRSAEAGVLPGLERGEPGPEAPEGGEAGDRAVDEGGRKGPGFELKVERFGEMELGMFQDGGAVTGGGEGDSGEVLGQGPVEGEGGGQEAGVEVGLEPAICGGGLERGLAALDAGNELAQKGLRVWAQAQEGPVPGARE